MTLREFSHFQMPVRRFLRLDQIERLAFLGISGAAIFVTI
jgi:hypothetical protein